MEDLKKEVEKIQSDVSKNAEKIRKNERMIRYIEHVGKGKKIDRFVLFYTVFALLISLSVSVFRIFFNGLFISNINELIPISFLPLLVQSSSIVLASMSNFISETIRKEYRKRVTKDEEKKKINELKNNDLFFKKYEYEKENKILEEKNIINLNIIYDLENKKIDDNKNKDINLDEYYKDLEYACSKYTLYDSYDDFVIKCKKEENAWLIYLLNLLTSGLILFSAGLALESISAFVMQILNIFITPAIFALYFKIDQKRVKNLYVKIDEKLENSNYFNKKVSAKALKNSKNKVINLIQEQARIENNIERLQFKKIVKEVNNKDNHVLADEHSQESVSIIDEKEKIKIKSKNLTLY